jgi:hypothetical protein
MGLKEGKKKKKEIAALTFLGRALQNYKNISVSDLSHEHSLKYSIGFYFYNVRYLSHR